MEFFGTEFELREYLSQVASEKIARYVDHCLSVSFSKDGMVLQDLVNELGRRLNYKVTNGRYQGTITAIGFDGIWNSPEGHSVVLEVKTTDVYRISLDTIAEYRRKLVDTGQIDNFRLFSSVWGVTTRANWRRKCAVRATPGISGLSVLTL
jgi:hypothetical protein